MELSSDCGKDFYVSNGVCSICFFLRVVRYHSNSAPLAFTATGKRELFYVH